MGDQNFDATSADAALVSRIDRQTHGKGLAWADLTAARIVKIAKSLGEKRKKEND